MKKQSALETFKEQSFTLIKGNRFSDELPELIDTHVEGEHAFRFLVYVNSISFVAIFLAANGLAVNHLIDIVAWAYAVFTFVLLFNSSRLLTAILDKNELLASWRMSLSYLVYDWMLSGILLINSISIQSAPTSIAIMVVVMAGFMSLTVSPRSVMEFVLGKVVLFLTSSIVLYLEPSASITMVFPMLIAFILMSVSAYWVFVMRLRSMTQHLEQQYVLNQLQVETNLRERLMVYVGHDLRQPINAIGMLLHSLPHSDQRVIEAKECVRSSKRLINEIVQFADFNKELKPNNEWFSIQSLFDSIELEYSIAARQAGCKLRIVETSVEIFNDYKYITRIIKNYVSNALTHAAGAKILVGVRRRKNSIDIVVIDSGPGIVDFDRERIFDEFVKGQTSWNDPGFGLGLAIAKHYTEVCSAKTLFDSERGSGSMFGIRLAK